MATTICPECGRGTVTRSLQVQNQATAQQPERGSGRTRAKAVALPEGGRSSTGWPFEAALIVSGVRCVVRYMVLPFVLPLAGVATAPRFGIDTVAAFGILLILDVIAGITIVATLRRLWRYQHPRRWLYLPVATMLAVVVGFLFVNDAGLLTL
jgi:hypothetical protein